MERMLDELITKYVDVAAQLFPRVAEYLGLELPITREEWASLGVPQRGETSDGIEYFKHGYGVALKGGKYKIDLDLGKNGEINGFDAWRLFDFAEGNVLQVPFGSHREIESALKDAEISGDLICSYSLYYRA